MPTNGAVGPTSDRIWRPSPRRRKTDRSSFGSGRAYIYTRRADDAVLLYFTPRSVGDLCACVASLKSTKERKVKSCRWRARRSLTTRWQPRRSIGRQRRQRRRAGSVVSQRASFDRWSAVANTRRMTSNSAGDNWVYKKLTHLVPVIATRMPADVAPVAVGCFRRICTARAQLPCPSFRWSPLDFDSH